MAKQTIKTTTRKLSTGNSNGGSKGAKRCPTCGKFMGSGNAKGISTTPSKGTTGAKKGTSGSAGALPSTQKGKSTMTAQPKLRGIGIPTKSTSSTNKSKTMPKGAAAINTKRTKNKKTKVYNFSRPKSTIKTIGKSGASVK